MQEWIESFSSYGSLLQVAIVIAMTIGLHGVLVLARKLIIDATRRIDIKSITKVRTIIHLVFGTVMFCLYFGAFGVLLAVFGISLTAYLASASVIGLAVAFGSQSIVQDVITGLTVILSDLIHVDDMVEISGETGVVKSIGMRFTVLRNAMGADVFIPNRTLNGMVNYPKGYVGCLVDIALVAAQQAAVNKIIEEQGSSLAGQFPAIFRGAHELQPNQAAAAGRQYTRIKFKIWPGRGGPIETVFRQELLAALRREVPDYPDSGIVLNYEVDQHLV